MTIEEWATVLVDRKRAYTLVFGESPASLEVLRDLTFFCRGKESCLIPGDHDRTYAALGRHEVYLRIKDFIDLSLEQLLEKYTRPA